MLKIYGSFAYMYINIHIKIKISSFLKMKIKPLILRNHFIRHTKIYLYIHGHMSWICIEAYFCTLFMFYIAYDNCTIAARWLEWTFKLHCGQNCLQLKEKPLIFLPSLKLKFTKESLQCYLEIIYDMKLTI